MKSTIAPNQTKVIEQSIQFDREKTLGISDEVVGHITTILSGFYANSEYAVARETISNGLDACAELGVEPRVDITLSGSLADSHFVEFQDRGVGMSPDIFAEYFAEYGKSTKQHTNTQTGFFGLGAKSFYAISSHDVMVTTENAGIKTLGIFGKDDQNKGTVKFKHLGDTDSHGTSVRVPLKNRHSRDAMLKAIKKAAYVLPPNTVFVNGEPMPTFEENIIFTFPDNAGFVVSMPERDDYSTPVQALLGNILYPLDNFDGMPRRTYNSSASIILTFDLSDELMPLSHRDSLEKSPHNARIIQQRLESLKSTLTQTVQSHLNEMTHFDAVKSIYGKNAAKTWSWWYSVMGRNITEENFTWNDKPLSHTLEFKDDTDIYVFRKRFGERGNRITEMTVNELEQAIVFNDVEVSDLRKQKIMKYYNHRAQQHAVNIVLLPDNKPYVADWVVIGGENSDVEVVEKDEILEFTATQQNSSSRTDYTIQYDVVKIDAEGNWETSTHTPKEISQMNETFGFMRGWNSEVWQNIKNNPYFMEWASGKSFVIPRNTQKEELILKRVSNTEDWRDDYNDFIQEKLCALYSKKNIEVYVKAIFINAYMRSWQNRTMQEFFAYAKKNYSGTFVKHVSAWYEHTLTEADQKVIEEITKAQRYIASNLVAPYSQKVEELKTEKTIGKKYPLLRGSFENDEVIFNHLLQYVKLIDEQEKETD